MGDGFFFKSQQPLNDDTIKKKLVPKFHIIQFCNKFVSQKNENSHQINSPLLKKKGFAVNIGVF